MPYDDQFGYHELLHASHIMACMWGDHIEDHGALETNPELKAEADRIGREVGGFYQTVARASDERFPDDDLLTAEKLLEDTDLLTVNILRTWNRERIERFAKHLLGAEHLAMGEASMVKVGEKIRALRKEQQLSLQLFAVRIGVSYGYLGQVERGEKSANATILFGIRREFEVDLTDLVRDGDD